MRAEASSPERAENRAGSITRDQAADPIPAYGQNAITA
jgi:hypothetical protein